MFEKKIPSTVTIGGECFDIAAHGSYVAPDRDGVEYRFQLTDLTEPLSKPLLVSIYRFGPKEFYSPQYDVSIEDVLVNKLRRAFDSKLLSFTQKSGNSTYREIPLSAEDFARKPSTLAEIQAFIQHKAYWFGFRYNPQPGYPLDFALPIDLEYLGVDKTEIKRFILLMAQRGELEKVMEEVARPTHKLIDSYKGKQTTPTTEAAKAVSAEPVPSHEGLQVFVSHSSKDVTLAEALLELLKAGLNLRPEQIRCSSVDGYKLPMGVDTEKKLRQEVNAAKAVIGLITPSSLRSSYVMFELGARWGAKGFLAPLLAGVKAGELRGPLGLLNALDVTNESDLHQMITDIGDAIGILPARPNAYLKYIPAVKSMAGTLPAIDDARGSVDAQLLKVSVSADGLPPHQILKVIANEQVTVSRIEYMTSAEACIAAKDVNYVGDRNEIPVHYDALLQLWNTPRFDRNPSDHSGPAKMGFTVSAGSKSTQHILPVYLQSTMSGNTFYIKIVGSKTFDEK